MQREKFVIVVVSRLFLINMVLTKTIQSLSALSCSTSLPLFVLPTGNIPLVANGPPLNLFFSYLFQFCNMSSLNINN